MTLLRATTLALLVSTASAWAEEPAPPTESQAAPAETVPAETAPAETAPAEEQVVMPTALQPLDPATADEPPPPPVVLKNIPPRFSWDMALMPSFGMQPQFVDTPPWLGLGFRASWGKHFKAHRVGAGFGFSIEGALSVQWSNNFEPQAMWDFVSKKHLWVGASLGLDLQLNVDIPPGSSRGVRYGFVPAPMAGFRIGYSQYWSLISRRFFVGVEPRLRMIGDLPAAGVAIMIGSGVGY